jgi:hypothetical protein
MHLCSVNLKAPVHNDLRSWASLILAKYVYSNELCDLGRFDEAMTGECLCGILRHLHQILASATQAGVFDACNA